jgi:hypothetical protein
MVSLRLKPRHHQGLITLRYMDLTPEKIQIIPLATVIFMEKTC